VLAASAATDLAALLPLQEALGYNLAQSLFSEERNLVVEELTDYWYLEAVSQLLREGGIADLNDEIALIPAGGAGKVVLLCHNSARAEAEGCCVAGFGCGRRAWWAAGGAGTRDREPSDTADQGRGGRLGEGCAA